MNNLISERETMRIKFIIDQAITDYISEAKSDMDYWSEDDERECKSQVIDEVKEILDEY